MSQIGIMHRSYEVKEFVPLRNVLENQGINTRVSLKRLSEKFIRTKIGKSFYEALESKNVKNTILIRLKFEAGPTLAELTKRKILKAKKPTPYDVKEIGTLLVFFNPRSRALDVVVFDVENKPITTCVPYDTRYTPERINLDMYCIYVVNLCRQLSSKYWVEESRPVSFQKISQHSKKRPVKSYVQLFEAP